MHLRSHWTAVSAFVLALVVSEGFSKISAREILPSPQAGICVVEHQGSDGVMVAAAAESSKPKNEKRDDASGTHGNSVIGQGQNKETEGPEAADEVQGLKSRIIELQNKGKIGFRKIVLCSSVQGFGIYSPLELGGPVSKVVFYCEPANVSTILSEGRYIVHCSVDAFLMDSAGKPLLGKENVVKIDRVSRSPVIDLFFKIELNLPKLATRKVIVKITLHDKIKNQSVSVTRRINVEGGTKKMLDKI